MVFKKVAQDEVLLQMEKSGLIPVFNHTDPDIAKAVLDASYQGGVRVFEFTNRGANALEVFEALVTHAEKYPDLLLGIGTIFSAEDAKMFLEKGAQFIVSPGMVPEMATFCAAEDVLWIPGCATVSEIHQALELGAKMVKAFPGNVLGPRFVKAVKAVFPKLPIMPTGGVSPTEENLKAWFDAGVVCVGMGSKLVTKEVINAQRYDALESLVKHTLGIITNIRN
ncbi:MAG: bifunctional 4-hydroxy-2-oxoglutarate aldolase/2-dehydro-3-deoxy-phosphogluconate aldolase [Bacteroidota bacterium]